jgi:RNA polymerase sigma-70 factor (ECF subfamily)
MDKPNPKATDALRHDLEAALRHDCSTRPKSRSCGFTEYGPEAARRGVFQGMLFGTRRLADPARLDGLDPAFFRNVLPQVPRVEPRPHRGEWLLVHWHAHGDGEAVRAISRVEADGDRLTRVRNYFYTPDVLAEICAELEIPFRSNGYRYWKPSRQEA